MTDWVRTDYLFDDHRAVFTLTCRCGVGRRLFELCRELPPDKLAAAITEVVLKARPELAGCVVYFMRYDSTCHCWEIGVTHQSLPICPLSSTGARIRLDPSGETDL